MKDTTLIDATTGDEVTVVGPPVADGRILIQRVKDGTLDVIDVQQLHRDAS